MSDRIAKEDYVDAAISSAAGAEVGDLCWSTRTSKTGWLLCDGSDQLVASYPDLAAHLGTTYGDPEDVALFRLPDFRDHTVMGASGTKTLGTTFSGTLPNHAHSSTLAAPAHTHELNDNGWAQMTEGGTALSARRITVDAYTTNVTATIGSVGADSTSRTTAAALAGDTGAASATALTGSIGNPTTSPVVDPPYTTAHCFIKT